MFGKKLDEIGLAGDAIDFVMHRLPDYFTYEQLEHAVAYAKAAEPEEFPVGGDHQRNTLAGPIQLPP